MGKGSLICVSIWKRWYESRRCLRCGGKWVWRNVWIHLGRETTGMKALALPFLSFPPLFCSPATHKRNSVPGTCAKSFESSSSPLVIMNTEKRVEAEDRLSAGEEQRGPRVSPGDGFCEQLRKSGKAPPAASSYITSTPGRKCSADKPELKCLF